MSITTLDKGVFFAFVQVEIAFAQFDTSGDDKLNYKEFCLMIIQREKER